MMFALGIRFLNGWFMAAADGARKEQAEWPPHPDRVFMAIAAAWFETGKDEREGEALLWLEGLPPPLLYAPEANSRRVVISFVPVNDDKSPLTKKGSGIAPSGCFPIGRRRQPRTFPVAIPSEDRVYLIWPDADASIHRSALLSLCRKVIRIGHSASFVQMWVEDNPPPANLVPEDGLAVHWMRVFGPGRLFELERRYNRDAVLEYIKLNQEIKQLKGKKRKDSQRDLENKFGNYEPVSQRPEPQHWQGYSRPRSAEEPLIPKSVFDPRLVILAIRGKTLGLRATGLVVETVRKTVMSACAVQPPPEWLSGHQSDGQRSERPHLAIIPLPFVGFEHADGRIMGVALVLPRDVDPKESSRCLEPLLYDEYGLPKKIRLFSGRFMECEACLEVGEAPPVSLRAETWTRPSRVWASVTPIVLDRHSDGPDRYEYAAEVIKDSCERIGIPRPAEVLLTPVSVFEGVPHAREFEHFVRKSDGGRMWHTHAILFFPEEVSGPVLIGAGRYRGYGLCRPTRMFEYA